MSAATMTKDDALAAYDKASLANRNMRCARSPG
jgi:hypothetical protein